MKKSMMAMHELYQHHDEYKRHIYIGYEWHVANSKSDGGSRTYAFDIVVMITRCTALFRSVCLCMW